MSENETSLDVPSAEEMKLVSGTFMSIGPLPEDPDEIRTEASNIRHTINRCYGRMGQLLYKIQSEHLYKGWGFGSFAEYASKELGWEQRKAEYIAGNYKSLVVGAKLDVNQLDELEWTKGRELAKLARDGQLNEENVDEWLGKAQELSVTDLQAAVRDTLRKPDPPQEGEAGPKPPESSAEPDEKLTKLVVNLYEGQYSNVLAALAKAGEVANSEARNHQLDVVCLEYLASHIEGEPEERLAWFIGHISKHFGVNVLVLPKKADPNDHRFHASLRQTMDVVQASFGMSLLALPGDLSDDKKSKINAAIQGILSE